MKKIMTVFGAIVFVSVILTSCKTIQVPKFTSVENLYQLKQNSSLESVMGLLGSKPYNVLSSQVDGYTIYTYKYKLVERKIRPRLFNKRGGESNGRETYNNKTQTAFLFFKADKLEGFVTTEGRKDSPALVMLNNTLYTVTKNKDRFVIVPTTTEEPKETTIPLK